MLVLEDIDAVFSHGVLKRPSKSHETTAAGSGVTNDTSMQSGSSSPLRAPSMKTAAATAAAPLPTSSLSASSSSSSTSAVSLSELLNALDGVGAQAGRLVVMTTNAIDQLDEALV